MIGVGNGVSHDLIKRGALYGQGFHLFVMRESELKKQIVGLLSSIVVPAFENVELEYNKNVIKKITANFDKIITRGSVNMVWIQFEESAKLKNLENETITIKYVDRLFNK